MAGSFIRRAGDQLETKISGAGFQHIQRLRQHIVGHKETVALHLADPARHGHGFGGSGGFVQQRSVGQFQPGQVDDHLLEVEQGFQTSLGDFCLVRGVGGVPAGIFQHIAQDDRRGQGRMVAKADERFLHRVLAGGGGQIGQGSVFGHGCRQRQQVGAENVGRNGLGNQIIQRAGSDRGQHGGNFVFSRADMALDKFVVVFELVQRGHEKQQSVVRAKKDPASGGAGTEPVSRLPFRRQQRQAGWPCRPGSPASA